MENKFSDLPPLKRYRLMQQRQQQNEENNLPAKKRKSCRDSPPQPSIPATSDTTSCLDTAPQSSISAANNTSCLDSPRQPSIPAANNTSCLDSPRKPSIPAAGTKFCEDSPPQPSISAADDTAFCLPAKKRIWAIQPFDLNQEYEPLPNVTNPEIAPDELQKSPEVSNGGQISRSEHPATPEIVDDDDGIVCAVCDSTDGDAKDPIVLCDGCNLMVHASCYGHPFTNGIPDGEWFCAQCLESKSEKKSALKTEISCCLCPVSGGALKPTTDGRWAHLVCAIYVPEVFFEDCEGIEGINCSKVVKRRWERKCYLCKWRKGCVVDCSEPKCPLAFHVTCGLKEELCIEYRQRKNRGGVVAAFCKPHTNLWTKQQQTGKFKIVARDEI